MDLIRINISCEITTMQVLSVNSSGHAAVIENVTTNAIIQHCEPVPSPKRKLTVC